MGMFVCACERACLHASLLYIVCDVMVYTVYIQYVFLWVCERKRDFYILLMCVYLMLLAEVSIPHAAMSHWVGLYFQGKRRSVL